VLIRKIHQLQCIQTVVGGFSNQALCRVGGLSSGGVAVMFRIQFYDISLISAHAFSKLESFWTYRRLFTCTITDRQNAPLQSPGHPCIAVSDLAQYLVLNLCCPSFQDPEFVLLHSPRNRKLKMGGAGGTLRPQQHKFQDLAQYLVLNLCCRSHQVPEFVLLHNPRNLH